MSKAVTLENLAQLWQDSNQVERSEIVYILNTQGISQATIAVEAGASFRTVKSRKHDANVLIKSGQIPTGKFELNIDPKDILNEEMDRRDRLTLAKKARSYISSTVLVQGILDEVFALVESIGLDDSITSGSEYKSSEGTEGTETAIMDISDLHYCRQGNGMDENSIEAALWRYIHKSLAIIERQRKHTQIDTLHVFLNGDNIHGLHNFVSQSREVTGSLSYQISKGAWLFIKVLVFLRKHFKMIHVLITGGNHGKVTPKDDLMTENAEFLMGYIIQAFFANDPAVEVDVAYGEFYRIVNVQGQKFFVTHGDKINGSGTADAITAAFKRWDSTGTIAPWDSAICGHFHRCMDLPLPAQYGDNRARSIYCGGTASKDDKFIEGFGGTPSLQYWLLFVNDKRTTASYKVDLYD